MCRQYYDAFGLSIVVLRPDYIVDSRIGLGKGREMLGPEGSPCEWWVCRHGWLGGLSSWPQSIPTRCLKYCISWHSGADATCNAARAREILGLQYAGNLQQYGKEIDVYSVFDGVLAFDSAMPPSLL